MEMETKPDTEKIKIGDIAMCVVTEIEGVVVVRHDFLFGVPRIGIQPPGSFEGKAHEVIHMDIFQAEKTDKTPVSRKGTEIYRKEIVPLGVKAKDRITGFQGICTGRAEWLYSCTRVLIQPQELNPKTRQPVEAMWFEEGSVDVLEAEKKEEVIERKTGGPGDKSSASSFKADRR